MKKLNITAAKELKKEKDKYQCEVDKIYKKLIENTLDEAVAYVYSLSENEVLPISEL